MADLRFSRSEEEGDAVVAQVSESGFKIVDFKCNLHAVRRNRPIRVTFDCERSGADVVLDAIGIRTDRRVRFQSQYAFVKDSGAAHVADSAANEGDLFDLHCSLPNQVISRNRGRTLLFA